MNIKTKGKHIVASVTGEQPVTLSFDSKKSQDVYILLVQGTRVYCDYTKMSHALETRHYDFNILPEVSGNIVFNCGLFGDATPDIENIVCTPKAGGEEQ